uniref:ZM domain-containing protein n=1 Tax=Steinernema glaseri TaxID=37863 RepID=A0A1I7YYP6_9BILA
MNLLNEKFVPSPMEEQTLVKPQAVRIVQHSEDDISRAELPESLQPETLTPQKAQIAYYRPFVPDPVEETTIPGPERASASFHDVSEISAAQRPRRSTLERPQEKRAELMYTRPGFDNVPSY